MFLHRHRNQIYLLHSQRDGRGRVRQRRLGQLNISDLERCLRGWDDWCSQFSQRYPDILVNWAKVREQAEKLVLVHPPAAKSADQARPTPAVARIRRALQKLLTALENQGRPEVLAQLGPEIGELEARLFQTAGGLDEDSEEGLARRQLREARRNLPPGRRIFDPGDVQAQPYLHALDRLSAWLAGQGRLEESAVLLAERLQACPAGPGRAAYGAVLQRLGRFGEALEQYETLPNREAVRHYNVASIHWQEQQPERCLARLLRAVVCDQQPARALAELEKGKSPLSGADYWDKFGQLWDAAGRRFILGTCDQMLVRWLLRRMRERGVRVRELVKGKAFQNLLKRGLASVEEATSPALPGRE